MMKWFLFFAFLPLVSLPVDVMAEKGFSNQSKQGESRKQVIRANSMGNQMLQRSAAPRISSQRAASLVRNRYSGSRILGVTAIAEEGSTVYRVRTLSDEGVVKSVFVDGSSGEVFE